MSKVELKFSMGTSSAAEEKTAAVEAIGTALSGAESPVFAFVFCTSQYRADEFATCITQELKGIPWGGCCAAGVFGGPRLLRSGVAVGIVSSPQLRMRTGIGVAGPVSVNAFEAGRAATLQALENLPAPLSNHPRAIVVLGDAIKGNIAEVIRGCAHEAGTQVLWAGGGSSDDLKFIRAAQFAGGRAYEDHVVVIALDATSPVATGIRHGWRPYGPPVMVTKSRGSVASELEYESAFEVYQATAAHRGDKITRSEFLNFAITHPMGIPQANGEFVIRDPLKVENDGSLRFVGEIPDGSLIRVMEGTDQAILNAATEAAHEARQGVPGALAGALIFDCVSRSVLLGEKVGEELQRFQSELGAGVPMVGCLTLGEVGSIGKSVPQFHNKTAVVLALAS